MATNPYLRSAGSNPYLSPGSEKKGKPSPFSLPLRFVGNLVTDVKDAVVGLPAGAIMTIRDPIKTAKAVGTTSWQTWSPLFQGHPGQFAENFYNHPLAPLLDVATVFTLGAGGAARGAGGLAKAGVGGKTTQRVAGLRVPREVKLADPTGQGRHPVFKQMSGRAGRRLVQEGMMSLEGHLPQWVSNPVKRARYGTRFNIDMAHRAAAKNLMLTTMLKAGEKLSDANPDAPKMRAEILAGAHINLMRHNKELAVPAAKAREMVKSGHYRFIRAPEHVSGSVEHAASLARVRKMEAKWDKQRADNAALAHELPRLKQELKDVNDELTRMHREGWRVTTPASDSARPGAKQLMEQGSRDLMDVQRRSLEIERRIERAHNAETKRAEALAELDVLKNQRMELERRGFTEKYASLSGSAADFELAAHNFARHTTTRKLDQAARVGQRGDAHLPDERPVYVVPRHDAKMLGREMGESASFLRKAWEKPTYLWKLAMIGYTPRSIVNNAVGNWAIYAMREGGSVEGVQALYDAVRLTRGPEAALMSMKAATPYRQNNWLYRYFGTELGNVFGHELLTDGARTKSKLKKRMRQGLYPAVQKIADEPVRIASLTKYLRESPEVKALMKQGMDTDDAIRRALRTTPGLQRRASEHARVVAGDYFTLRKWERVVRDIIPFYLWDRHIVKTTGNMVADTPGRVAIMQHISNQGVEETEALLGDIPEFLKGAIPLEMLGLGSDEGRKNVLLTASLNPWATIGEIASLGRALTVGGGEPRDALMGAHPFITGGIEFVTGRSIMSGAPKDTDGGLAFSVVENALTGLPGYRIGESLLSGDVETTKAGNPLLYRRDDKAPFSSFLGVPIRAVSPESAASLAAATGEAGKEPKKSKNPYG